MEGQAAGRVIEQRIGLGCMRLSTSPDRDPANGIRVIHAALDSGVTHLDTADVYCFDDNDIGHNERLIAEALRTWSGDRTRIEVATKGGLRRPKGGWVPDGRAVHLKAACAASRTALGVDIIDLYYLHVVDARVPLETSLRALAALQRDGLIRRVGLSNVTVSQIEIARAIVEIDAVQVPLSVIEDEYLRNGVAEYCAEHGIRLVAYRPLGGRQHAGRLARAESLRQIAQEQNATAPEIAIAWLLDLHPCITPIPGPTQPAHARQFMRIARIALTSEQRAELDARFNGRLLRVPRAQRRAPDDAAGDVVIIMGMPGAGKSTLAQELVARGYIRLNRDAQGGRLRDLVPALDEGLAQGQREWVLDNTYASRADRSDVLECAWRHGVPVRVIWLDTDIADAQINAITRLIETHGTLPMPEDIRARGKSDHRYFGPDAQFRYLREMEPPHPSEGFKSIERRTFQRRSLATTGRKAVFFDPTEVDASLNEALRAYQRAGWLLIGLAWNPPGRNQSRLRDIKYEYVECKHSAGPPVCWCRKPLPGLVLACAARWHLDLPACILAGSAAADQTMALRLGMQHVRGFD
ncbi:MAG TPA: aldo/keto reductase [Longimicrobiales bacterium]